MSSEDDWPSQVFRDNVISRLEPELARNRQNAPNLPVPGDARQVEEYVFQKCVSKDEYMRTIAKVINAINCNSKSAAVPSVLQTQYKSSSANGSTSGNGAVSGSQVMQNSGGVENFTLSLSFSMPTSMDQKVISPNSYRPTGVPPDPQPTHQQRQQPNNQYGNNSTGSGGPMPNAAGGNPLGQPPPMMANAAQNAPGSANGISPQQHGAAPQQQPPQMHQGNHMVPPQQQPHIMNNSPNQMMGGYGMQQQPPYGMHPYGPYGGPPQEQQRQLKMERPPTADPQAMWSQQQGQQQMNPMYMQPPSMMTPYGNNMDHQMHPQYHAHLNQLNAPNQQAQTPVSSSSVLENLINQPHYANQGGALQTNTSSASRMGPAADFPLGNLHGFGGLPQQNVQMSPEEREEYDKKMNELRKILPAMKLRSAEFKQSKKFEIADKFDVFIAVLEGRKVINLEYLLNFESWVNRKRELILNPQRPPFDYNGQGGMMNPPYGQMGQVGYANAPGPQRVGRMNSGNGPMAPNNGMNNLWQQSPYDNSAMLPPNFSHHPNRSQPYPIQQRQVPHMQQAQQHMMMTPPNTNGMQPPQFNMPPTSSTSNIEDLYVDDFLPTPLEPGSQQGGMGSIASCNSNASTPGSLMNLCDPARVELENLNDRFVADQNTEIIADHIIVKCTMRHRNELPSLRLVIPRNYPQSNVTIERVPLDLDSFYYDDLQNAVYENFSKMTVRSITEALNTWENSVNSYYSSTGDQQMNRQSTAALNFDELLSSSAEFDGDL
ncbi:hypothetical protein QR680_012298 [Steinernema hermaphroditum]|uniref:Mediator of RNA polymerase II transcription subunit 15 n=1 Tax=Steinernema hermaphroditum TaxID=289476 RepID=A0AA39M0A2_9BILA|nr:hypothetical protein QR680_012298 [Steinernema hermaphroditum]